MVETNPDSDYLLPFFEQIVFEEDVYNKLKMDDSVFIKKDSNQDLSSVTKIKRSNTDLGSLRLITVCLASDFMGYSNLCNGGESPFYIKEVNETRTQKTISQSIPFLDWIDKKIDNLYSWRENKLDNNDKHKLLDVYVENADEIQVLKNSKSSIKIYTTGKAKINDKELEVNKTYIIKFQLLDRSGARSGEYFMHKSIIDKIPNKENTMLDDIKKYINLFQKEI